MKISRIACVTVLLVSACGGSAHPGAGAGSATGSVAASVTASVTPAAVGHGDPTLTGHLMYSRFDENSHAFTGSYVAQPDGTHEAQVAMPGPEGGGRWSHSGGLIAVMTQLPDGRIGTAVITASGKVVRTLKPPGKSLNLVCTAWSPDDTRLACEGWDDSDDSRVGIYTVRASDGGGLVRLTKAPYGLGDLVGDYSPDGREFVFKRAAEEESGPLYVVPVAGGRARQLTKFTVEDPGRYSPDGTSIATSGGGVIKILDVHGEETGHFEQQGAYSFGPVWSPDGQHLAYSVTVGDSFRADVYTSRPDGTDRRQVTSTPQNEIRVEWGKA